MLLCGQCSLPPEANSSPFLKNDRGLLKQIGLHPALYAGSDNAGRCVMETDRDGCAAAHLVLEDAQGFLEIGNKEVASTGSQRCLCNRGISEHKQRRSPSDAPRYGAMQAASFLIREQQQAAAERLLPPAYRGRCKATVGEIDGFELGSRFR